MVSKGKSSELKCMDVSPGTSYRENISRTALPLESLGGDSFFAIYLFVFANPLWKVIWSVDSYLLSVWTGLIVVGFVLQWETVPNMTQHSFPSIKWWWRILIWSKEHYSSYVISHISMCWGKNGFELLFSHICKKVK